MASILSSASQATSSVFFTVTTAANVVTKTVDTIGLGMDALHSQARIYSAAATQNVEEKITAAKSRDLTDMQLEAAEYNLQLKKKLSENPELKAEFELLQKKKA